MWEVREPSREFLHSPCKLRFNTHVFPTSHRKRRGEIWGTLWSVAGKDPQKRSSHTPSLPPAKARTTAKLSFSSAFIDGRDRRSHRRLRRQTAKALCGHALPSKREIDVPGIKSSCKEVAGGAYSSNSGRRTCCCSHASALRPARTACCRIVFPTRAVRSSPWCRAYPLQVKVFGIACHDLWCTSCIRRIKLYVAHTAGA
jgi:hypothetical protein